MNNRNDTSTTPGASGPNQNPFLLDPPLPKEALRRVTTLADMARKKWQVDYQLEPVMWSDQGLIQCAAMPANRDDIEGVKRFIRKQRRNSQTTVVAQEVWLHPPTGPRLHDKEAIQLALYLPGRVVYWQALIRRPVLEDFVLLSDSHSHARDRLVVTEISPDESCDGSSNVAVDMDVMMPVLHIKLISESGERIGFGVGSWLCLIVIAQNYGWQPAGTLAPPSFAGHWNGTYRYNQGQGVSADDAQALAQALERALPDLPRNAGERMNPWPQNSATTEEEDRVIDCLLKAMAQRVLAALPGRIEGWATHPPSADEKLSFKRLYAWPLDLADAMKDFSGPKGHTRVYDFIAFFKRGPFVIGAPDCVVTEP